MEPPIEGHWYWVSADKTDWWPAKRDSTRCGGWTNEDTWEDFDNDVKFWILIGTGPDSLHVMDLP